MHFFSASYGSALVQIAILNFVAVVSPGPDFAIVVRNSLVHSRKAGVMAVFGILAGETVHLTYILLGVRMIISKNLWILNTIKILGCLYLSYLGLKMLRAKKADFAFALSSKPVQPIKLTQAFQQGFFTNLLNPKAVLFFLGLFSVVVDLNTPFLILMLYGAVILCITFLWFMLVALLFSKEKLRCGFLNIRHWIERITGSLLIFISFKLALTQEL